jgi:hypothetical protein
MFSVLPAQKVSGPDTVITLEGDVFTTTVTGADTAQHPAALITRTAYEPAVSAL